MKEDWIEVELGDICDFVGGGTPSKSNPLFWNGELPWASIKDIKSDFLKSTQDYITEDGLKNSSANLAMPNEIILATRINPGKPIISKIKTAINQDLKVIKTKIDIESKFLFYSLKKLEKDIVKVSSGTTVLGVNLNNLRAVSYCLAPLPIQRAIVSKIEALFSDLDNGIADLKKAQEQLKIYRQAVLKKAFEASPTKEKKNIIEIVEKVQIGPFGSQLHKEDYITNGIPLINPMHIQEGKIKPNPSYSISEVKRDSLPNYILEKEDVIMGRRGEMGRCGLVSEREVGWFCGTGSLYLRPIKEMVYAPFLFYYMSSSTVKEFLTGSAKGTTMMNLNKKIISNIPINLPQTIDEQHQIVREIESRLSICDKIEQNITEALNKSEALRQSILKKAFEGKLLSRAEIAQCKLEKDYEPASVLLEKIKKEKDGK